MIEEILRFNSLKELLKTRKDNKKNSLFLAGGTEINRLNGTGSGAKFLGMSLEGLGLNRIEKKDNGVHIGAMVTLQQLIDDPRIPEYLKVAAGFAGSRTLRNMATLGGNVGALRDDSYLVPTLIAAKARLITAELQDGGTVESEDVPIREFIDNIQEFNDCCIVGVSLNKHGRCVVTKRYSR
ncbi:MAG: FAD binding domain-containing protein, partial [Spirochaetales bacterium]|nr:FAD binding domain-containing protein [Spirochaetales bacterium]